MKNELLLKELYKVKNDYYFIDTLIEKVKNEIAAEACSTPTEKAALKAAIKYLKNAAGKYSARPALGYAYTAPNGCQYFTNSYSAFEFKKPLALPDIAENPDLRFPAEVIRFFPEAAAAIEAPAVNYNDVCNELKQHPDIKKSEINYFINLKAGAVAVSAELLKEVYTILNSTDLKVYYYGQYKPLLLINEATQDRAVLCPKRVN